MTGIRFIAGSGRSGTTWVQDALAAANGLRPVFEPLHPYVSAIGNRYAHRALAPDEDHPDLAEFLTEVCAGQRNRLWTQFRRQRRWLLPPSEEFWTVDDAARLYRRWNKFLRELPKLAFTGMQGEPLVKCIRANLMLGWLSRKFGCRVVLIVRHPAAVIESELRERWNARFALDRFRQDALLHELTTNRYRQLLERNLTPLEGLAARWVVENQWVVERAPANGVPVVFYEHLKSSPDQEWQRIQHALELSHAPPPAVIAQPSQQSAPKRSAATAGVSSDPRWMRVLSREQMNEIQGILDCVGVTLYTTRDPEPQNAMAVVPQVAAGGPGE